MSFFRPLVICLVLVLLACGGWLWWSLPSTVDLANYVPADSFVYIESNSLSDVVKAIQQNQTWQSLAPTLRTDSSSTKSFSLAARAGIGPTRGVIFSRAQVALAVVGLNTSEESDTLKIKPEVAVLIETHTTTWRMKSTALDAINKLASFAYGQATCLERSDNNNFIECSSFGGDRKIVAAIDGTLVVIGNTEKAVSSILEVKHGIRPSLRTDTELLRARIGLNADRSLAFGYISSKNAAQLLSWAAPLLMGKAPGDQQVQKLLSTSASKILRGVAWTSQAKAGGIEDRYLFALDSNVVATLKPAFVTSETDDTFWRLIPESFQAVSIYRSKDPLAAWSALDSAVALKLDAVSAVIFGALLKSGLSVYGIDNPKELLPALNAPLLTLRATAVDNSSILLARIGDAGRLRSILSQQIFKSGNGQILDGIKSDPDDKHEFSAVLTDGYLLLGKTGDIRSVLQSLRSNQVVATDDEHHLREIKARDATAILTYTNDESRVGSFASVVASLKGVKVSGEQLQGAIRKAEFSTTETSLDDNGIERRTRSAFGQFSTLLSLMQPENSTSALR